MWTTLVNAILFSSLFVYTRGTDGEEEPILYYYGIEESERGLPSCAARQACAALVARYWRAPALVRLCRCPRRQRCDAAASAPYLMEINNRAYFQFCQPVTNWPQCSISETALVVETDYDRMDPEQLEELHHQNIQLFPPKITFNCKCRNPNYWRLTSKSEENSSIRHYRCSSLPVCRTGEFCGNINSDMFALYQSCLCPKHHICVHNGGVTHNIISELLYHGTGWKAHCQRIEEDSSYEDY